VFPAQACCREITASKVPTDSKRRAAISLAVWPGRGDQRHLEIFHSLLAHHPLPRANRKHNKRRATVSLAVCPGRGGQRYFGIFYSLLANHPSPHGSRNHNKRRASISLAVCPGRGGQRRVGIFHSLLASITARKSESQQEESSSFFGRLLTSGQTQGRWQQLRHWWKNK